MERAHALHAFVVRSRDDVQHPKFIENITIDGNNALIVTDKKKKKKNAVERSICSNFIPDLF